VEIPQKIASRLQQHVKSEVINICKKAGLTNVAYTKVGIVEREGKFYLYVKLKLLGKMPYEVLDSIAKLMREKYARKIMIDSPHLHAIRLSGEIRKEVFKEFKKRV